MGENELTKTTEKASLFTIKNVLRVLSVLCIIFVFCPSFLVSCSDQTINVNVMTAVGGLSSYGQRVVDPHPIMLICLLIPVAVLVLMFLKKFADNITALITVACGVVDIIVWFIFRSSVRKVAEENYCEFKTTGWYVLNIIALLLIILLSALVVLMKIQLDTDLVTLFSGEGTKGALSQMSATMSQMSSAVSQIAGNVATNMGNKKQKEDTIGYCSKCGSPIVYGCKFCTSCGTPVPESMLAEAEAAKKAAEEAARKAEEEAARKAAEEAARKAEEEAARKAAEEAAAKGAEKQAAQAEQEVQTNNEKPKFCQNCGAKLAVNAAFCNSCGTKVE